MRAYQVSFRIPRPDGYLDVLDDRFVPGPCFEAGSTTKPLFARDAREAAAVVVAGIRHHFGKQDAVNVTITAVADYPEPIPSPRPRGWGEDRWEWR